MGDLDQLQSVPIVGAHSAGSAQYEATCKCLAHDSSSSAPPELDRSTLMADPDCLMSNAWIEGRPACTEGSVNLSDRISRVVQLGKPPKEQKRSGL